MHYSVSSKSDWWKVNRPSSTDEDDDSDRCSPPESVAETLSSIQVNDNDVIQFYDDENRDLRKSIMELNIKYKNLKKLKRNPSQKLQSENQWLEKKVEKCRRETKRRQKDLDNLTEQYKALEEQKKYSDSEIDILKTKNRGAVSKIAELEKQLNLQKQLKNDVIETYKKRLQSQQNELTELKTENQSLKHKNIQLEQKLKERPPVLSLSTKNEKVNQNNDISHFQSCSNSNQNDCTKQKNKTKLCRSSSRLLLF